MDTGRRALLGLAPIATATPMSPSREAIRKRYLPDTVMETHEGKTVRFYQDLVKDHIVVINFMYLNCEDGGCPITTHSLVHVQKRLKHRIGRDIFMYSVTLDPERDTAALLKKHLRAHGIGPGWTFLRASPQDTDVLRRKLGFKSSDPVVDANKSAHAAMVRFGNEPRQLWAMVSGFASPQAMARAILWVAPKSKAETQAA